MAPASAALSRSGGSNAPGSYRYPVVRLHAIRDYYSMAVLAAEHDVHVTFNLTPVLLRQIDDYLLNGATDGALDLTRRQAEKLTKAQVEEVLSTFFDADWQTRCTSIRVTGELFEQRTRALGSRGRTLRTCRCGSTWRGSDTSSASGDVRLITGDTVRSLASFGKSAGSRMTTCWQCGRPYKIMRAVVPIHRALQESGRIEVSTTPAFHPILPLLIDTDPPKSTARRVSSDAIRIPEDAAAQIELAPDDYWPASVEDRLACGRPKARYRQKPFDDRARRGQLGRDRCRRLARSGDGAIAFPTPVLCQRYCSAGDTASAALFFRDTDLSDGIGLGPGGTRCAWRSKDFLHTIETRFFDGLGDDDDRVLTIVLDGENAWGGYPEEDGHSCTRCMAGCRPIHG